MREAGCRPLLFRNFRAASGRIAATLATTIAPFAASAADILVPFAEVPFALEAPDQPQELASLWGRRAEGPAGTYLRTPGRWEAPLHAHTADYRAVVIQGTWMHWVPETGATGGVALPPGSYWTQAADQPHKDACVSDEACIILLVNQEPYETYLPD